MLIRPLFNKLLWLSLLIFLSLNFVAAFHAYRFTHFATETNPKTASPNQLSGFSKLKTLLFGVKNPRPENSIVPEQPYQTIYFTEGEKNLEGWLLPAENPKGTVVLFHGFSGQKSSLLHKAEIFRKLKYNVLLVDFRGSGGSEGNQTTIGFTEAEDVKTVGKYLQKLGEENIILFGTSMGAVAIMKAIHDQEIAPTAIMLECPFGNTVQTVKNRFKTMKVPPFPMAHLLTFWGGALNGFNAFAHNPETYATGITCPVLLLYGEQDEKVSLQETEAIFQNLAGPKTLRTYPEAGHENYLSRYRKEWTADVTTFLNQHDKP